MRYTMRYVTGLLMLMVGLLVGLPGPITANGVASAGVEVIADRPAVSAFRKWLLAQASQV